jgi:arsenate reductase
MIIYGIKACDTCRKAVKALEGAGKPAELVDIRATPLSGADRARFLAAFGDDLINRRSTTWRGLSEEERQGTPEALLAAHPTLMKRPVIDTGDALYLGWDAGVRQALL